MSMLVRRFLARLVLLLGISNANGVSIPFLIFGKIKEAFKLDYLSIVPWPRGAERSLFDEMACLLFPYCAYESTLIVTFVFHYIIFVNIDGAERVTQHLYRRI